MASFPRFLFHLENLDPLCLPIATLWSSSAPSSPIPWSHREIFGSPTLQNIHQAYSPMPLCLIFPSCGLWFWPIHCSLIFSFVFAHIRSRPFPFKNVIIRGHGGAVGLSYHFTHTLPPLCVCFFPLQSGSPL